MKNLILLAVFGLLAIPANAQNDASVTQEGDSSTAEVTQASSSFANIYQLEDGGHGVYIDQTASRVTVRQVGNNNLITGLPFDDENPSAFDQDGSSLTARQYGDNNSIAGSQSDSRAEVYQNEWRDMGDGNAVELIQANSADADIEQEHYDDGAGYYEGNIARLTQDGDSYAFIRQDGGDNEADAYQVGDTHDLSLTQQGREMDAAINQYGSGNIVQAIQHNWYGTLDVNQGAVDGASSGNAVYFNQSGDKFTSRVARIDQDGTGNMVGQDGAAFTQTGDASLTVSQVGTSNLVMGSQAGTATATVVQDGTSNTATIIQN
jgi:hypothetical protein